MKVGMVVLRAKMKKRNAAFGVLHLYLWRGVVAFWVL